MTVSFGDRLRGFGPTGIAAALLIVALGGIGGFVVLAWARVTRTSWQDLGLSAPRSWALAISVGTVSGVLFKLAMKAVVMPVLGASPVNATYHFLAGNTAALPGMILVFIVQAGFGEEVMFRGFLFERLGRLWGDGVASKAAIVLVTSIVFSLEHMVDQGIDGAAQALITGAVFGTWFARTGRLWSVMVAHAAFDLTALVIIYYDAEPAVAHMFFTS